jgi:hypothetical protein
MPLPLGLIAAAARIASLAKTARTVSGIVGKGNTNVNPVYRNMEIPKAPPGGSKFNPNPPKPPTGSSIPKKSPHVSENRTPSYKLPEAPKSVPKKNPTKNKGSFSGDMAPYNWTGK